MGSRRGGDGATRVTSTALPAAAATTAQADAWMDALWEIHCGTPLAGAVRYTDAIVETMWGLFQPLLSELDVYPLAIADMQPETVTATTAATVPFTDFIVLRLMEPATPARHGHRHRGGDRGDVEEDPQNEFGNALTAVMRTALLEQPCIVLALVEFFTAVWLYQYEARKLSTLQNAQHGTRRQGDGGAQGTGPPTVSAAASRVPALRRVYAAVSGDVRHATPFDQLGAAQLGRVLTIKGTVVRMSPARISCVCMSYRCGHCGVVKQQRTQDGVLTYPGPCASARCRGYKWTPLTDQAVCEEVQLLRLQEHTTFFDVSSSLASPSGSSGATQQGGGGGNGSNAGSSGMHVMIEVELRAPWLDAVTVGDSVCVCGVLETRRDEGKQGSGMQQVCLRARAVRSLRSQGNSASSPSLSGIAALQRRQRDGALLFATMGPGDCRDGPWRLAHGGGAAMFGDGTSTGGALRGDGDGEGGADDEVMLDTAAQLGGVRPTAIVAATTASAITALPSGARVSFPSGLDAWSAEETGRFYEVARHPQWFARLVASVAPSIFGMELVKQALLLSIVGGNRDKNGGETRSSIHVLLLGDPGLGKSQLLRAACAVAPRSSFVCAHTSSSCGLTMTLTRDPVSGETTFEAGAVVHGDGGITCLDEIDKGVQEHKALLEVMEQETVSLAKAGMIFSMPVRTSILAAGNPIGGRVDPSKSLAANVNISPALLSRFDIIACLRNPHGHTSRAQQALTDHVLQWHRRGPAGGDGGEGGSGDEQGHGRGAGPLPLPLVQRFLLFCRSQCQPTLCPEACDVLKAHYLAQRQHLAEPQHGLAHGATASCAGGAAGHLSDSSSASGPLPRAAVGLEATVTPRYLQALIRVAEARAKLELRHAVTREDAEYAVQLLQSCLHSFDGLAASGSAAVGAAAGSADVGAGRRPAKLNQRDAVLQRLKLAIVEENGGVNLFTVQAILDVCESVGCRSAAAMLRQLNEHGFLLQKGSNRSSMLKSSIVLLRRGKPRPRAGMFPEKYRRVPALLKPQQGGQQYFNEFLIRSANDALEAQQHGHGSAIRAGGSGAARTLADAKANAADGINLGEVSSVHPRLPQADMDGVRQRSRAEAIQEELKQLAAQDGFVSQRGFNERQWYEQEHHRLRTQGDGAEASLSEAAATAAASSSTAEAAPETEEGRVLPQRILSDDYFQSRFGYSLLKGRSPDASTAADNVKAYAQLDLWGEMPRYSRDFVFLYLVSRRRNTYAVAYDYDGKRLLPTYTAGNRGLKGGDRGFRGDGSTDNGHQVTSMYLNDLLPKIREARAASGRPLGRGEKIDLVVRVMGFYNGRQGAVRAVQDRNADFRVRYLEDVTPFPLNGPKMPRGVFR